MNLHAIAAPYVAAVNATVTAQVQFSLPPTTQADGTRTPNYSSPVAMPAQVQALTYKDLQQIDGLNLQGTRRAIYFYGDVHAVKRVSQQGGDLVTLPDTSVWLVAFVFERWPNWVKVCCILQNGS